MKPIVTQKLNREKLEYREAPPLRSKVRLNAQPVAERRKAPRISGPLPAVALDVAACKQSLGVRTVIEDLSTGGFSLRLAYPVEEGEKLLVITQVSQAVVLLRGEVTRVERQADDTYRLALSITRHQIFSSLAGDAIVEEQIHSQV